MNLKCSKKFLNGFTTPEISIADSAWSVNPYLDKRWLSSEFTNGYINPIIRQMLDSEQYKRVVADADTMRMLYASHHMKRRDSVLPIIKKKLLNLADKEKELLTLLVDKAEKELDNETLELFEK